MSAASLFAAQQEFTVHLPAVEDAARWAFGRGRRLGRQDYEDVLAEVRAAAWSAWVGLLSRGKDPVQVGVHGIANNAVRYVRNGRRVANRSCGRGAMDVYHPEARKARGFRVINPDSLDETVGGSPSGRMDQLIARRPTRRASGSTTSSGSGPCHPGDDGSPSC